MVIVGITLGKIIIFGYLMKIDGIIMMMILSVEEVMDCSVRKQQAYIKQL